MATPSQPRAPFRLKNDAEQFWERVSEGLEVNQLWSQFEKDARSSYRLYSAGLDERPQGQPGLKRAWHVAKALFWAILEKLTPARRVLLLIALILLFFPVGGFTFGNKAGEVHVVEFDFRLWGGLTMLLVLLLELADRVVMKRDLEIARDIQSWLLPGAPLQLPGYQIAYATRPANTVAGDYYDVILRPASASGEDRILFVVADVAGKSIPAAMLMATFQASLRTLSSSGIPLEELVVSLNRYACSNSVGGTRFTTVFLAELNPATGDLVYVNAGHNAPILRKVSGAVERLDAGGIPLGILPEATHETGSTKLNENDWLVVFTDGVVEAVNTRGEEYEEPRFIRLVDGAAGATPSELLRRLLADLDEFVGNTPQHDDVTCLLLKRST
ncbi:MAG TPA: PP2C family protein-serine/threonine phosphatase [Terriglobales bacterium]|jgi:sigma-B regulation protein RsbU (phosphoserine phosphatase)|nr:PP2C family protein-serine/threonine phosphatase [Terriglobales bacterium]